LLLVCDNFRAETSFLLLKISERKLLEDAYLWETVPRDCLLAERNDLLLSLRALLSVFLLLTRSPRVPEGEFPDTFLSVRASLDSEPDLSVLFNLPLSTKEFRREFRASL